LPGIYFVAIITLLFWVVNIGLLLLAEKVAILKKIFPRAAISIVLGIALSTTIFHYFRLNSPPPFRVEARDAGGDKIISFGVGEKAKAFKFSPADSNFIPIERPVLRQQSNHFFSFRK